mmetsp:Transcript_138772/g.239912  ORF Transcript_138772/g.239912 Transcript_138772/m.239912 type:complete len:248 (-) Transcript_138772:367-1110(-)
MARPAAGVPRDSSASLSLPLPPACFKHNVCDTASGSHFSAVVPMTPCSKACAVHPCSWHVRCTGGGVISCGASRSGAGLGGGVLSLSTMWLLSNRWLGGCSATCGLASTWGERPSAAAPIFWPSLPRPRPPLPRPRLRSELRTFAPVLLELVCDNGAQLLLSGSGQGCVRSRGASCGAGDACIGVSCALSATETSSFTPAVEAFSEVSKSASKSDRTSLTRPFFRSLASPVAHELPESWASSSLLVS